MKSVILIVEGKLDFELFSSIVPVGVRLERGTGKYTLATYVEIIQKRLRDDAETWSIVKPDFAFGFRDRDFDSPFELNDPVRVSKNGNIRTSFRRTIENYLLTEKSLSGFLDSIPSGHKLSSFKGQGPQILREAAEDIKYYQAARCALGEIRKANRLQSTWMRDSDKLPAALDHEACLRDARQYLIDYKDLASEIGNADKFEGYYQKYLSSFDESFWDTFKYEWFFQGKNLTKAIVNRYPTFPIDALLEWAIKNFQLGDFPDIQELIEELKKATQ